MNCIRTHWDGCESVKMHLVSMASSVSFDASSVLLITVMAVARRAIENAVHASNDCK